MAKRRPKDIGTADETAVVRYLRERGWVGAERRALRGGHDCGDITGLPGVMIEVKGGAAGRDATARRINDWLHEQVGPQTVNAGADIGVLVTPVRGIGPDNAGQWHAHMTLATLLHLTGVTTLDGGQWFAEGSWVENPAAIRVRVSLADLATMLNDGGY